MAAVDSIVEQLRSLPAGAAVSPVGLGTRWGALGSPVSTVGLSRVVAHEPGDFTAVLEAGVAVAEAQAAFARHGQWLALDPPPGGTIGGLFATADSGPSRHRYGGARDLIIGATVVLADGTVAASGGQVIKNVAGYDLAKLFTGSLGTLGLIASVSVRLHPLPAATATVRCPFASPEALGAAAVTLANARLEALSLDAAWSGSTAGGAEASGALLVRFAGDTAVDRARAVAAGLPGATVVDDDEPLWTAQRAGQRRPGGVVVKVSGQRTDLPRVLRVADAHGATVVSRAGLGLHWLSLASPAPVAALRTALAPLPCVVLDGDAGVAPLGPAVEPGLAALTARVKAQFDPTNVFRGL